MVKSLAAMAIIVQRFALKSKPRKAFESINAQCFQKFFYNCKRKSI